MRRPLSLLAVAVASLTAFALDAPAPTIVRTGRDIVCMHMHDGQNLATSFVEDNHAPVAASSADPEPSITANALVTPACATERGRF